MTDLLAAQAFLAQAVLSHPHMALVNAFAWLDPVSLIGDATLESLVDELDEEGYLAYALLVCRAHFRDIYVQAICLINSGGSYRRVEQVICDGLSQYLPNPLIVDNL